MKLALFTRFVVFVLVAVLALGPVMAFAAPTMNTGQSAASNMTVSDDRSQMAQQSGCAGCPDTGMAKAAMAVSCNAGCPSMMMLPSAILFAERMTTQPWVIAFGIEHSGVIVSVDPYPPNFSS